MIGQVRGIDRARRDADQDGEPRLRNVVGDVLKNADLVGGARPSTREHETELRFGQFGSHEACDAVERVSYHRVFRLTNGYEALVYDWMHILFLFVDGIGLGEDADDNPFATLHLGGFERLSGGQAWLKRAATIKEETRLLTGIDPRLGVERLPQSGTGHATLFTGINCAKLAGRHYGPYPHSKTRPVIAEHNIFRRIERLFPGEGEPAAFANAYPDRFFDYVKRTDRWTVTTRCCLESNVRIRSNKDLAEGLAVPADLTGYGWPERFAQEHMPADENEAAERLLRIAAMHRFTLFEYFLTDKAGHRQRPDEAAAVLASLDRLLDAFATRLDTDETLLVLTSDHGNLEDLSTKTHTMNDVPFAAYGRGAIRLAGVRRLEEVTPAILELLRSE